MMSPRMESSSDERLEDSSRPRARASSRVRDQLGIRSATNRARQNVLENNSHTASRAGPQEGHIPSTRPCHLLSSIRAAGRSWGAPAYFVAKHERAVHPGPGAWSLAARRRIARVPSTGWFARARVRPLNNHELLPRIDSLPPPVLPTPPPRRTAVPCPSKRRGPSRSREPP